jgi:4-aminobutyrate aminotransferase/(S)-3-amino-2-methylpropionate transaminase
LPHGGPTKTLLVSTGAEAVENAIKIARQATKRQGVLCFTDAFHGRTLMAMTLTSKVGYKPDCGPFAPEVYRTQFPNFYRYGAGRTKRTSCESELHRLEELSHNTVAPENLAAIIMEPVQGEGGFNVVPAGVPERPAAFCDKHGILLILDEIQSGFGRTGAWSAFEQYRCGARHQHLGEEPRQRHAHRRGDGQGRSWTRQVPAASVAPTSAIR